METEQEANRRNWWFIGIGATAALGLATLFRSRPTVEHRLHVPNLRGVVEADPQGLADAAGVPLDVYAFASAMQSEEHSDRGRLAVGRAIWNAVKGDRSKLVLKLLPHGYFASQDSGQYAATSKPPTARTLGLAVAIIEGRVPDFVEQAVQWDAPLTQDRNHQLYLLDPKRFHQYRFSSKDIAKRRVDDGAHEVRIPGVPETRFWAYA
jgi:hypothetical protein